MRELSDYEMENIYGGFLNVLVGVVSAVILSVAAYKMITSESAKIKLPGGTDISFSGSKNAKPSGEESTSRVKTSSNRAKTTSKKVVLKQLNDIKETYTSSPSNFLEKL